MPIASDLVTPAKTDAGEQLREEEFKVWMQANGASSESGRNTRTYAVRTIEKNLRELGFTYEDLDAAWASDKFEDVKQAISELRADFDQGGTRYRLLMPNSQEPRNRLAGWRRWLGQYGRFLNGEGGEASDADHIRTYVLEHFIEPARERDEDFIEFVVKDVNDALSLNQAWPNICQAMRGRKFQELADVPPPQSFGADMSTATRFRFDLERESYWALAILRDRYGQPQAHSKKMASFVLRDGRQIAIDLESARTQLWLEGDVANGDQAGISVTRYVADAPRHSNLPSRLRHKGPERRNVSLVTAENAGALEGLLERYDKAGVSLSRNALGQLRQRFLDQFPDFTGGGGFAGRSSYHPEEDDYKRALIARAQELKGSIDDPELLGAALLDLVAGKGGLKSNLLGQWMPGGLKERRAAHPGLLEHAAGAMVQASDPREGVIGFVDETWQIAFANAPSKPYGDSRTLPTMVAALVDPERVVAIWTDRFNNLFSALFGEKLFGSTPLQRSELQWATAVANQLLQIMRDEWGWTPRDLWDVQGFVWVTCKTAIAGKADKMTDEQLLARFDGSPQFQAARKRWTASQVTAFCEMARAVHDAGLDWYHTDIPEVRFGRKSLQGSAATGTLGSVRQGKPALAFSHQSGRVDLAGEFQCSPDGAATFLSAMKKAAAAIANWQAPKHAREGYWPDDYGTIDNMMNNAEPQNIILYGPPGTGKTWRTAIEAVRLCDGEAPDDRASVMARYQALSRDGRIRFVTFHQNFSYEEFVEGLRPETGSGDGENSADAGFRLEPRPGIFKELCAVAEEARKRPTGNEAAFDLSGRKFWKMSLGQIGSEDSVYEEAIAGNHIALGWGGDVDWSDPLFLSQDAIREKWTSEPRNDDRPSNVTQLHPFRNVMQIGDIVVVPYGNKAFRAVGEVTGNYYFERSGEPTYYHRREVRWLAVPDEPLPLNTIIEGDFQMRSFYSIAASRVNREALARLIGGGEEADASAANDGEIQQFVLVIDEINRANISKVLGELITLIEPDKRLGMPNELKVQLPYSKREFGVPANLHIVGTMNTADRSIALLDTALRRRFRFEEMAPDVLVAAFQTAETATGLPLGQVLTAMNRRIEYLVDRDHRIGHAFFIGCTTKTEVDAVMRDKVIPLLQEYFFDDWNRLAAVLGEKEKGGNFLTCETLEDPMGEGGAPLKSWSVRQAFDEGAYGRLVSAKPVPADDAIPETPPE